jgi:lipopolysaccharide export system protein LptC
MAVYDNTYSRMVAWLKIILPLAALAILSTLFLASKSTDLTRNIPVAQGTVEDLAREQRIGKPSYAGVIDNGTAVTLTAKSAHPPAEGETEFKAADLRATLSTPGGETIDAIAPEGHFDIFERKATLAGGVTIKTSAGYTIQTTSITANLKDGLAETQDMITGDGPLGHFEAGQMVLKQQSGGTSSPSYELVFKKGVHLVYLPQQ